MKRAILTTTTVAFLLSGCASTYTMTPVISSDQTVRYDQGRATTDQVGKQGAVKVTPVRVAEDGRLVFAVAALNTSNTPVTFGVENISMLDATGNGVRVFTHDELVRQAKNRATWAAVATALAGASAAYAANQNAYRTTNATMMAPGGRLYTYSAQTYDPTAAAIGTAAATAATGATLYAISNTLDRTIAGLGEEILQTTTIDPNQAWGGQVIAAKLPGSSWPRDVEIKVQWNGETFPFKFKVNKTR